MFIIALAVAYYFVIFIPQKNKEQIDLQKKQLQVQQQQLLDVQKQSTDNKQALNSCLATTEDDYHANWDRNCKQFGINNTDPNCTLPGYLSDRIGQNRKDAQDLCFKKYPQN